MYKKTMALLIVLAGVVIQSNVIASEQVMTSSDEQDSPHNHSSTSHSTLYRNTSYPPINSAYQYSSSSAMPSYAVTSAVTSIEKDGSVRTLAVAMKETVPVHLQSTGLKECFSSTETSKPLYLAQALNNTFQNLIRPTPTCPSDSVVSKIPPVIDVLNNSDHKQQDLHLAAQIETIETCIKIGASVGVATAMLLNKSQSRLSYLGAPLACASVATGLNAKRLAIATSNALDKHRRAQKEQ